MNNSGSDWSKLGNALVTYTFMNAYGNVFLVLLLLYFFSEKIGPFWVGFIIGLVCGGLIMWLANYEPYRIK